MAWSPSPSELGEEWAAALARFRAAEGRLRAVEERTRGGSFEEERKLDRLYDRRLGGFYRALRALLKAPAPDLAAFAVKFDLMIAHEVAELRGGRACLRAMRRDLGRIGGPVRPFPGG